MGSGMTYGKGVALVLGAGILWSTIGLVVRQIDEAGAASVMFWRSAGLLPVLWAFLHWRNGGRVLQGSAEDDMPSPRMFFELLMLGERTPQVVAFALEQENHYVAPAFRQSDEGEDPFIPYREMSDTELPAGHTLDSMMAGEHRWLENQLAYMRGLIRDLRLLAELVLADAGQPADTSFELLGEPQ